MNKLVINLFGKELRLRFGGLCWEYFSLHAKEHLGQVRSMALLVFAAILNEDEVNGASQNVTFEEVLSLVDSAWFSEKEYEQLGEAEKMFQEMAAYKKFLKANNENRSKKKELPKK